MIENKYSRQLDEIAASQEGQQLKSLLSSTSQDTIDAAGEALCSGDMDRTKELLTPLLARDDVRELLKKLSGSLHG